MSLKTDAIILKAVGIRKDTVALILILAVACLLPSTASSRLTLYITAARPSRRKPFLSPIAFLLSKESSFFGDIAYRLKIRMGT